MSLGEHVVAWRGSLHPRADESRQRDLVQQLDRTDGLPGRGVEERGADVLHRDALEPGPGQPIDRELDGPRSRLGLAARRRPGLPVDDVPSWAAVRLVAEHRVDPAPDDEPVDRGLDGDLDRLGRQGRPAAGEEPFLQRLEVGIGIGVVRGARQLVEVHQRRRAEAPLEPGVERAPAARLRLRRLG